MVEAQRAAVERRVSATIARMALGPSTMLALGSAAPAFALLGANGKLVALAGAEVFADQKPSIGHNIKWKPGNAPDYA